MGELKHSEPIEEKHLNGTEVAESLSYIREQLDRLVSCVFWDDFDRPKVYEVSTNAGSLTFQVIPPSRTSGWGQDNQVLVSVAGNNPSGQNQDGGQYQVFRISTSNVGRIAEYKQLDLARNQGIVLIANMLVDLGIFDRTEPSRSGGSSPLIDLVMEQEILELRLSNTMEVLKKLLYGGEADLLRDNYCLLRVLEPIFRSLELSYRDGQIEVKQNESSPVSGVDWNRLAEGVIQEFLNDYLTRAQDLDQDRRNRLEEIAKWLVEHRGKIEFYATSQITRSPDSILTNFQIRFWQAALDDVEHVLRNNQSLRNDRSSKTNLYVALVCKEFHDLLAFMLSTMSSKLDQHLEGSDNQSELTGDVKSLKYSLEELKSFRTFNPLSIQPEELSKLNPIGVLQKLVAVAREGERLHDLICEKFGRNIFEYTVDYGPFGAKMPLFRVCFDPSIMKFCEFLCEEPVFVTELIKIMQKRGLLLFSHRP